MDHSGHIVGGCTLDLVVVKVHHQPYTQLNVWNVDTGKNEQVEAEVV